MVGSLVVPFFSDFHAPFVRAALKGAGLGSVEVRSGLAQDTLLKGLSHVNNDACYSAIAAAGQVVDARCETCVVPRICADCRAEDELGIVRRALCLADRRECAVLPLGSFLAESGEHALNEAVSRRLAAAVVAGDVALQATLATTGCAALRGDLAPMREEVLRTLESSPLEDIRQMIEKLCARADFIAKGAPSLPPIALVGNAPVLFCEGINAHVVSCVEEEGCRAVMPPLSTFALHALICAGEQGSFADELRDLRASVRKGEGSIARLFSSLTELRAFVEGAIPVSLTYGSGWLLPALMMHMAGEGVFDAAYLSTFGCLSGHVVGKGALNIVRGRVPCMNVASLEFDQGTSVVNQINRLKLLVSTAKQRANGS